MNPDQSTNAVHNANLKAIIENISSLKLPSPLWKVNYDSKYTFLILSTLNISGEVKTSKSVVLTSPQLVEVQLNLLLNSKPINIPYVNKTITNIAELSVVLSKVDNLKMCNKNLLNKDHCLLVAEEGGDLCVKCRKSDEPQAQPVDISKTVPTESLRTMCTLCEEQVENYDSLLKHERRHLPNPEVFGFKCSICNQFLDSILDMVLHYYKYHDTAKFIKCLQCKLKFNQPSLLRKHISQHKFNCIKCDVIFSSRSAYKQHTCGGSPFKKKNYICDTCKIKYSTSYLLKQHQKEHEIAKTYKCQYCTVKFENANDYNAHKNDCKVKHLRFVCKVCSERYSCVSQRTNHMNTRHANYVELQHNK